MNEIIANYASRYFKGRAGPFVPPASVKESWKLLGQGYLTAFLDLLYTFLMVDFILQLRFLTLLFVSPVRWWQERRARKAQPPAKEPAVALLQESSAGPLPFNSVTEQTTERLPDYAPPRRERA
jgi:hypothetical protein